MKAAAILFVIGAAASLCGATGGNQYADAARDLDVTISKQYAYLGKLPGGQLPQSDALTRERNAVHDDDTLLAYAEKRIASLADHHAITGNSFGDSWAVVPTYADLWVVKRADAYVVDAVRSGSPAADAGIVTGEIITQVDGTPIDRAVSQFWVDLGLSQTPARADYAARVLVAGRRDRTRKLTIQRPGGASRDIVLPSLYDVQSEPRALLTVCAGGEVTRIRVNNSLGEFATIAAFDEAMRAVPADRSLVLDLRDTPSGGNTTVARAIMGWFVDRPRGYQIHNRPSEGRETGIERQWIEQVLPRDDKYRSTLPTVLVGRWTGSMGEGIAIGFASLGAKVQGTMMAGLNGSVEDLRIGQTDLYVKLPTERLMATSGTPREDFVPDPLSDPRLIPEAC